MKENQREDPGVNSWSEALVSTPFLVERDLDRGSTAGLPEADISILYILEVSLLCCKALSLSYHYDELNQLTPRFLISSDVCHSAVCPI